MNLGGDQAHWFLGMKMIENHQWWHWPFMKCKGKFVDPYANWGSRQSKIYYCRFCKAYLEKAIK